MNIKENYTLSANGKNPSVNGIIYEIKVVTNLSVAQINLSE